MTEKKPGSTSGKKTVKKLTNKNPVARTAHLFNKAAVHTDKKQAAKRHPKKKNLLDDAGANHESPLQNP
ncbi:MAG TPA: hypothetical protein PLF22_11595 [Pseudomonadales bacterium]|nr:hypothetical protein [Pseudomonadales bacterium]